MPDVWATVTDFDEATQRQLANVLETRGRDEQQRAMRRAFLGDVEFPPEARVLEVGCGTGVLTRTLARSENVASVVGVDVASALLAQARKLSSELTNIAYEVGDARALPAHDESYDVVVFDSTLTHVPEPERALAEAFRVVRPGGTLAIFDGDYASTTVALGDADPLQTAVDAMMAQSVTDRWLARRLPALVADVGFELSSVRSHAFQERSQPTYMLTIVDRGVELLLGSGSLGEDAAAALKAEARRRVDRSAFFGQIVYVSVTASKPAVDRP